MKRWTLFLLAALLLATLSPTCAPVEEPTEAPAEVVVETLPPAAEEPTESAEQPPEPVPGEVVSFWTWASTAFEEDALNRMVAQFSKDTGIDVDLQVIR